MRSYSTPMIVVSFVILIGFAWLVDLPWWMIAIGAVVAIVGYLLERRDLGSPHPPAPSPVRGRGG